jgi:hypothetical protein
MRRCNCARGGDGGLCASFTLYIAFVASDYIAAVGGVNSGCSGTGRVLGGVGNV